MVEKTIEDFREMYSGTLSENDEKEIKKALNFIKKNHKDNFIFLSAIVLRIINIKQSLFDLEKSKLESLIKVSLISLDKTNKNPKAKELAEKAGVDLEAKLVETLTDEFIKKLYV